MLLSPAMVGNTPDTGPTVASTPKEIRLDLIKRLETTRGSKVITYVTGTRGNLNFQIAMDSLRKIFEHIKDEKGKETSIDLFIHSNGGDGIVPWKLVTLVRDYAKKFSVIVPHRAFSAATLISLGADEIIMHPMGMLGPTDPTVKNDFNPPNPSNPGQLLGISVEDVISYIKFIKDDFGITHEDELVETAKILADKVHPLALGNVKRFHSQSRMLAKKLLALHMPVTDDHKIGEIVDSLTSKLFFHGHPINYKEAEQMGLKVRATSEEEEQIVWDLYLQYEEEMKLEEEFRFVDEFIRQKPALAIGSSATISLDKMKGVYVESSERTDVFTANFDVWGIKQQNAQTQCQLINTRMGWESE